MKLSEAVEVFIRFKSKELSPRTIKEYRSDLELFIEKVGDKPLESVKTSDIVVFRSSLDCSPSLINRRLSALSSFFKFLVDMELMTSSPVKPSLRIKRIQQRVPEALTEEEIEKVLNAAKERGLRDYLMVKTILYCGLRISELLSLRKDNLKVYRGKLVLQVIGKGNKERFIPVPQKLAEELSTYAEKCKDRLFPISYQGAKYVFNKIREKTGVNVHPHKLRHTFATILVDKGVDIRVIQAFLGHASPNTSARYAKVRDDVMFKVVEEVFSE